MTQPNPKTDDIRPETYELFHRLLKILQPPPDLSLSDWADRFRFLSQEFASEPGRWHTKRAPYQREIMNAITDIHTKKIVIMSAAQLGKTQSAILNAVGYYMHYDPCPMLLLEPTVEMAETVSKNFLSPMLRDTPVLTEITSQKSRDKHNTILEKQFPGGYIALQGANSPAALASRPIRNLFADEIDRYPASAGIEGDPLSLAEKRLTAFWNAKTIVTSTPTIRGLSRIETEYEHSTKEVWNIPCPLCGTFQPLTWEKIKFNAAAFREGTGTEVRMACENPDCSGSIEKSGTSEYSTAFPSEYEWRTQFPNGKYIAAFPKRKIRGFFVNALSSPFQGWAVIVEEFLKAIEESKAGNREPLKTWTNTRMAQTWDDEGIQLDEQELLSRAEEYGAQVPDGVLALTCGVDTQDNRFEYEIVAWGAGKESWGIEKGEIYGDMEQPDIWERLDQTLLRTFTKRDGTTLTLAAVCIDSQGHHANEVYRFCLPRWGRNVWAIKGRSTPGTDMPFISNPTRNNRVRVPLFTLGVDTGKVLIYDRLKVETPGPGYCHFPVGRGYDEKYFKGLTAEKKIITYKKGRAVTAWVLKNSSFRRNEPLDIRNYATAAMEIAHIPLNPAPAGALRRRNTRGIRNQGIGSDDT